MTVKEIAEKCGISNPNYFTCIFRKKTGLTPVDYRTKFNVHENTKPGGKLMFIETGSKNI
jgi:AraC-like DNA-binding protein